MSFTASAAMTAFVIKIAARKGFVSKPSADRYNRSVIPLGGGIAIFTTIAAAIIFASLAAKFLVIPGHLDGLFDQASIYAGGFIGRIDQIFVLLLCAMVLFGLGLYDDLKHLNPFFKLFIQFLVAIAAALFAEIRVEFFIENNFISLSLSILWIVLIINAFNFLDNMDGASAGIAAIVTVILLTSAVIGGQVLISGLAIVLIGALLGFLAFNFPPAKIFAGDAGSLVIGFFVAILSLRTTYYQQAVTGNWYPVLMPLVVMAVPLYDFLSVTFLRIKQGKSPFVGDTQHFSHRLKNKGLSDTQTVLTLYLATLCTGLGATFLDQVNLTGAILILTQTFMILAIIAIFESTGKNDNKTTNDKN